MFNLFKQRPSLKYSHKAIDNQTKTLQLFQEETFELEPESRMGFL